MAPYPHLSRWYAQLQKRPSFQEAVSIVSHSALAQCLLLCCPTPPGKNVGR